MNLKLQNMEWIHIHLNKQSQIAKWRQRESQKPHQQKSMDVLKRNDKNRENLSLSLSTYIYTFLCTRIFLCSNNIFF